MSGDESYRYDPLDNVRYAQRGTRKRHFTLHPTARRLHQITTENSAVVIDYDWNDRGELESRTTTVPSGPEQVVPSRIHKNGFEDSALVTPETFTFDRARRLMAYQDVATYQYDAHNRRVASIVPANGTRYQVYSRAGELLYVEDAGRDQRIQFMHLNGTLVAERIRPLIDATPVTVNYLHSDHRGTPTVKTSSLGTRVYRSRLNPYGTPYDNVYRDGPGFTKHATDEVGPLIYMQQRYYDPNLPTFISPDPDPARADNFNRYAYANNNPYTFVDPDGRVAFLIPLVVGAAEACMASVVCGTAAIATGIYASHQAGGALANAYNESAEGQPGDETNQAPERGTRELGELEPIHAPDHPQNDPEIGRLSDTELGEAINNPSNGDRVTVRGNRVLDGNTRINEANARGWPTNTTIPVDELPELPSNINDDPLGPYRDQ